MFTGGRDAARYYIQGIRMRIFSISLAALTLSLALTACNTTTGGTKQSREERGQAILAECIASECQRLDLDGARLPDYSVLKDLTHVRALMVSYTDFTDLSALGENAQYSELHIGASNVTDLSALHSFPNLKLLHVQDLDVSDYSPIRKLKNLEELVIGQSTFKDLNLVRSLPKLKRLNVVSSDVHDLTPLRNNSSIQVLDLYEMELSDLSPLLSMSGLRQLSISFYNLSDVQKTVIAQLQAKGVEVEQMIFEVAC